MIWGAGAIAQIPTTSDSALGSYRWGLGPTFVILHLACPLCLGTHRASTADQLAILPRVVIAHRAAHGKGHRVVEVINGARPDAGIIAAADVQSRAGSDSA